MQKALDISKHQSSFNASTARAQGISTTICRCAYAASKDICWDAFAPAVQAAGMQLGAYGFMTAHYASKASSFAQAQAVMRQQVQAWIDLCKAKGCTVLAVDQELEKGNTMLLVSKTYNTMLLQEAVAMIRAAGLTPMIYTGASWCLSYIDWAKVDSDFWVAYYPSTAAASDFTAYADGTFPGGQYGDLLRAMQATDKLWGWQYGSTGHGVKYGAGSVNIDRNWIYKEDKMDFEPITGKQLRCTSAENPKCETFSDADINASLGALELDQVCQITAKGDTIKLAGMIGTWYKIIDKGAEVYCLDLPDGRCVVEDAPSAPSVDVTEVLSALERIESAQAANTDQLSDIKNGISTILEKLSAAGAALQ